MDLDFLTEEVKKLARQTGEFLKKERLSFDRSRVEQKAAHGIWIKSVMLSRKMQSELLTYLIQLLRHLKH